MITVPKIVLIILAVVAVWYAFRWLNRGPANLMRRRQPAPPGPQAQGQGQATAAIEDLVACRLCGAYVATGARGCGKTGCPMPR